jgi:hypothetical protein
MVKRLSIGQESHDMAVYWLTFRLADDAGYSQRYDALISGINAITPKWWVESSSFILFESSKDIDGVAATARAAVSPSKDIVLIGMPDYKNARVIGPVQDQDLFALMPFTKKV